MLETDSASDSIAVIGVAMAAPAVVRAAFFMNVLLSIIYISQNYDAKLVRIEKLSLYLYQNYDTL